MDSFNEFVKQFTSHEIGSVIKIDNQYFLVNKELLEIKEKIKLKPKSIGVYLGEEKNKKFFASLPLLGILSKSSDRKVFVNQKAEWLFLCGRDLFKDSITKSNPEIERGMMVLVQNEKDENLGLGLAAKDLDQRGIVIKTIIDKGDYLRREMRR